MNTTINMAPTYNPGFFKNALKLMTGTSFAQLLGVIVMPLLTRLFSPEAFGLLQIYLSIVFIIVPLSTFNYEVAVLIPKQNTDALSILWGSLLITTAVTLLCYPILMTLQAPIQQLFKADKLGIFIYLVPISVFAMGVFNVLSFWLTRHGAFGQIAMCYGWQAIVNQGTKLGLGYTTAGALWGLLLGNILSDIMALIIMIQRACPSILLSWKQSSSWRQIKRNLVQYYQFPLFSLPSKFIYQAAAELPAGLVFIVL